MNASIKLKVKYGLPDGPTEQEIRRWEDEAKRLINAGDEPEEAGREAAFIVFGDEVEKALYFSEADSIEALLRLLAKK